VDPELDKKKNLLTLKLIVNPTPTVGVASIVPRPGENTGPKPCTAGVTARFALEPVAPTGFRLIWNGELRATGDAARVTGSMSTVTLNF
jgi:hypothetical protein